MGSCHHLSNPADRQSLIQASSRIIQPKFLRISVELQRQALKTFHQDLSGSDEDSSWDSPERPSARNLAVLTSCPEIFNWIHSKFSELLFELRHFNEKDPEKPDCFSPLPEIPVQDKSWNLRQVLLAFPDAEAFKEVAFRLLSGSCSVCFLSADSKDVVHVAKCFTALLPNDSGFNLREETNGWHFCNTDECLNSFKVNLASGAKLEAVGTIDQASSSSRLIRDLYEVVAKLEVDWSVVQVQLEGLRDRWATLAKVWKATKKTEESLKKEFLRLKSLSNADIKILDFWTSAANK